MAATKSLAWLLLKTPRPPPSVRYCTSPRLISQVKGWPGGPKVPPTTSGPPAHADPPGSRIPPRASASRPSAAATPEVLRRQRIILGIRSLTRSEERRVGEEGR